MLVTDYAEATSRSPQLGSGESAALPGRGGPAFVGASQPYRLIPDRAIQGVFKP